MFFFTSFLKLKKAPQKQLLRCLPFLQNQAVACSVCHVFLAQIGHIVSLSRLPKEGPGALNGYGAVLRQDPERSLSAESFHM